MKNKRPLIIMTVIAVLLLLPLIAMQFTAEVNWTLSDFIIMGILLSFTGLLVELALRNVTTFTYRVLLLVLILGVFFLTWAELAVGVFGTRFAGS